ncbi:MAG: pyridoxamine 5'-phosphate oxidase family protein [Clostridiales bacterium]|nr:pyridoxamine 5'-phosphate oxidase family protein [Clostridiales bacterium]
MKFREMRRSDRQIFNLDIEDILLRGEYGILSTVSETGYPYGVPVNYVYHNNRIFFHCAKTGFKIDNISYDEKVSFCVVVDTELMPEKFSTKYKSVIAFGTASEATGDIKKEALFGLVKKYSPDFMGKGRNYVEIEHSGTALIKIDIQHMTGKARL